MLCSFDELIDALFNKITDDTIRIDTLKEYYDTDFEEHKDELVYELKSEPGKYYTLEEIEEKNELLSQEEKDKLANSNKEFFEKYPSDYVKSLVENKLSQTTSSKNHRC